MFFFLSLLLHRWIQFYTAWHPDMLTHACKHETPIRLLRLPFNITTKNRHYDAKESLECISSATTLQKPRRTCGWLTLAVSRKDATPNFFSTEFQIQPGSVIESRGRGRPLKHPACMHLSVPEMFGKDRRAQVSWPPASFKSLTLIASASSNLATTSGSISSAKASKPAHFLLP